MMQVILFRCREDLVSTLSSNYIGSGVDVDSTGWNGAKAKRHTLKS